MEYVELGLEESVLVLFAVELFFVILRGGGQCSVGGDKVRGGKRRFEEVLPL